MSLDTFSPPPDELRRSRALRTWITDLVQRVIVQGAAATTTALGLVFKSAAVANASTSSVSVSASDVTSSAGGTYGAGEQSMLNDEIKPLVNELKADV